MDINDLDKLAAWSRYLYWAETQRQHYNVAMGMSEDDAKGTNWHSFALMTNWYSSLWVVIQGWHRLELEDPFIDELLAEWPTLQERLRDFHVAATQFSGDMYGERLLNLIREPKHPFWITLLTDEFHRYLWERIEGIPGEPAHRQAIRDSFAELTGWKGGPIAQAAIDRLNAFIARAEGLLSQSSDQTSQQAQDLRASIADAQKQVQQGPETHRQYREALLQKLRGA